MMSMNELMDAAKGVTNMFLAHEIAVDKDFHLEKLNKNNNLDDEESGGMEARIKKIVHQAFWDVLASELAEEPPVFNQVGGDYRRKTNKTLISRRFFSSFMN